MGYDRICLIIHLMDIQAGSGFTFTAISLTKWSHVVSVITLPHMYTAS